MGKAGNPVIARLVTLGKNNGISADFEDIVTGAEDRCKVEGIFRHFPDSQCAQTLVGA